MSITRWSIVHLLMATMFSKPITINEEISVARFPAPFWSLKFALHVEVLFSQTYYREKGKKEWKEIAEVAGPKSNRQCRGSGGTNCNGNDHRDPCKSRLNTTFSIRLWPITLLKISRFSDGSHDHRSTTRKFEFPVEDLKFHARRACEKRAKLFPFCVAYVI